MTTEIRRRFVGGPLGPHIEYPEYISAISQILISGSNTRKGIDLLNLADEKFVGQRLPYSDPDAVYPKNDAGRAAEAKAEKLNDDLDARVKSAMAEITDLFGPTIIKEMFPGREGMARQEIWTILSRFDECYRKLDSSAIKVLEDRLEESNPDEKFSAFTSRMTETFASLQRNGKFTSEIDRAEKYLKAIKTRGGYEDIIKAFSISHSDATLHTVQFISKYFSDLEHMRQVPSAYVANVTVAEFNQSIQHMQQHFNQQLWEMQGHINAVAHQGGKQPINVSNHDGDKKKKHYCFDHGPNNTHPSSECTFIIRDIAKLPGDPDKVGYTEAHLNAKKPGTIGKLQGAVSFRSRRPK